MGARGFLPKPQDQKILEGERPDRINQAAPTPAKVGFPPPPEDLNEAAVQAWHEIADALKGTSHVAHADAHTLAVLSDLIGRWREAERIYQTMGPVVEVRALCKHSEPEYCAEVQCPGYVVTKYMRNPLVGVLNDLATQIRAYSREFGLTPGARSALVDPGKSGGDGKGNDGFW